MTYDPVDVFAVNVRQQRRRLGWSQEKLAEIAGLDRTYIGSIERMERNPTLRSAQRIAHALDITLWELVTPHD